MEGGALLGLEDQIAGGLEPRLEANSVIKPGSFHFVLVDVAADVLLEHYICVTHFNIIIGTAILFALFHHGAGLAGGN